MRIGALVERHPAPAMAFGAVCISVSSPLIALSGTSPGTASFFRCLLAFPFLAAFAWARRRVERRATGRERLLAWLAGALFAGDLVLWARSIAEVGAGLSTVLVNIQVVIVPLLAFLIDREPLRRRYLLALPFLLGGLVLAAGLLQRHTGLAPLLGTVHAVAAAVCYAGFLYLLRRCGRDGQVVRPMLDVTVSAGVVSLLIGLAWHGVDLAPGWAAVGWLLLVALSSQAVGWLLISAASPRLPSQVGAVLLLITPVGAIVLGALLLGEHPSGWQLAGCAIILAAGQFATLRHRRVARGPRAAEAATPPPRDAAEHLPTATAVRAPD